MFNKVKNVLRKYDVLDTHIVHVLKAQFFIQLVGGAFFLILNIFLSSNGFSDSSIANFISFFNWIQRNKNYLCTTIVRGGAVGSSSGS